MNPPILKNMESKKGLNFFFIIIAIITGSKIIIHFDFQNFKFEKPALDIIYLITFLISIFILIRDYKKRLKNKIQPLTNKASSGMKYHR